MRQNFILRLLALPQLKFYLGEGVAAGAAAAAGTAAEGSASAFGSAALSAGMSAAGTALSSSLALTSNRKNRYWAKQQYYDQQRYQELVRQNNWERSLEQWNRENEYNSPIEQMRRYKEAGLNPNLIYGQQNLSASSPKPQPAQPVPIPDLSRYSQIPNFNFGEIAERFVDTYQQVLAMRQQATSNELSNKERQANLDILAEQLKDWKEKNSWSSVLHAHQYSLQNFQYKKALNDWLNYDVVADRNRMERDMMGLKLKYYPWLFQEQLRNRRAVNTSIDFKNQRSARDQHVADNTGLYPDEVGKNPYSDFMGLTHKFLSGVADFGDMIVNGAKNALNNVKNSFSNGYKSAKKSANNLGNTLTRNAINNIDSLTD